MKSSFARKYEGKDLRKAVLKEGWPITIKAVPHEGSLLSGWSLIRVVFHEGGLIRAVSHQGSLSSGWSYHGGLS